MFCVIIHIFYFCTTRIALHGNGERERLCVPRELSRVCSFKKRERVWIIARCPAWNYKIFRRRCAYRPFDRVMRCGSSDFFSLPSLFFFCFLADLRRDIRSRDTHTHSFCVKNKSALSFWADVARARVADASVLIKSTKTEKVFFFF